MYAISLKNNRLVGLHNLENIAAAVGCGLLLNIEPLGIEECLKDFYGLEHRMQLIDTIGKVEFINDSKATNVDSAIKSIQSIEKDLIVILGGKDKGGNFRQLEETLDNPRVRGIFLIGEAAEKIAERSPDPEAE